MIRPPRNPPLFPTRRSSDLGVNFAIPIGNGLKVELMVNRQDTNFKSNGGGLFSPSDNLANFHVTYFHGGLQVPFSVSRDRKSTRLNSSHSQISYAVFCLKKK